MTTRAAKAQLTKTQLEALIRAFPRALKDEHARFAFEDEVCTRHIGRALERAGMVRRHRLSHFPYAIQLQLTDAGRAAMKEGEP
jgi:DNA-binding MarR family transcriptional regulator